MMSDYIWRPVGEDYEIVGDGWVDPDPPSYEPAAGSWKAPAFEGGANSGLGTSTFEPGVLYFTPFRAEQKVSFDALALYGTATGSGVERLISFGLYSNSSETEPDEKIMDLGSIDFSSGGSTSMQTITFPKVDIPPGWFYVGIKVSGTGLSSLHACVPHLQDLQHVMLNEDAVNSRAKKLTLANDSTLPASVGAVLEPFRYCPLTILRYA